MMGKAEPAQMIVLKARRMGMTSMADQMRRQVSSACTQGFIPAELMRGAKPSTAREIEQVAISAERRIKGLFGVPA